MVLKCHVIYIVYVKHRRKQEKGLHRAVQFTLVQKSLWLIYYWGAKSGFLPNFCSQRKDSENHFGAGEQERKKKKKRQTSF